MRGQLVLALIIFFFQNLSASELKEVVQPYTGESYQVSVLTEAEAQELFDYLRTRSYIPFYIFFEGCFERSYQMITVAGRKEIELGQVIVDVVNKGPDFMKVSSDDGQYYARWYYHIAPYVFIKKTNGETEAMVIDPSLFDGPVSIRLFEERLTRENPRIVTETSIMPKWVTKKEDLLSNVNLAAQDRHFHKMMGPVYASYRRAGAYHEREPYYDSYAGICIQGGPEVECPAELLPANR